MSSPDNTTNLNQKMDWKYFLKAIGPAIVISAVVVGPGSVTTASTMGANYGYAMLWVVVFAALAGFFYQLPAIRITMNTGNSIMESVRIQYGKKISVPFFFCLLFGTIAFQAGNFLGGAMAMQYLFPNVPLFIWTVILVVIGFVLVWIGKYGLVENFTKVLVFIMVAGFLITAIGSAPGFGEMVSEGFSFQIPNGDYMLVLAMVATTMVPDIPVSLSALHKKKYMSSDSPEYALPLENKLKLAHFDLIVGCSVTAIITISIIICSAANLHPLGIKIGSAQDMAGALTPIIGKYAGVLFTLGLWSAAFSSGMFRIELMPLLFNQATGQEENMKATRSRVLMIVTAAAPVLFVAVWGAAPASLIVTAQAINGILLPLIAGVIWKISSDKKYLGENANKPWLNIVMAVILILAVLLAYRTFIGFLK